jgi:hypothetical protein
MQITLERATNLRMHRIFMAGERRKLLFADSALKAVQVCPGRSGSMLMSRIEALHFGQAGR